MKLREQIIQDALTGKLGTPFVPTEAAIEKEIVKRTQIQRNGNIPLPVRSDKTSDGEQLGEIMVGIENRLKDIIDSVDQQNNNLLQQSILEQSAFTKNAKQLLSVQDQATDLKVTNAGSAPVKIISDHFRTPKVDMQRSDVDISPQAATAGLRRVRRIRADLNWSDNDIGKFQIISGRDAVESTVIERGSSLNNLVDGTSANWDAVIRMSKPGTIVGEFTIPFSSKTLPGVNRIDLEANTPRPAALILYPETGDEIRVGQSFRTGDVLSWIFDPKIIRAIKFVFEWKVTSTNDVRLSLDDLGVYLDTYHGTGKLVSKSLATQNDDEINNVSLVVNEEIPQGTSINYFVALDPIVSGTFLNSGSTPVNAGYTAVEFAPHVHRPERLKDVYASDLRQWSHLNGAINYLSWEPTWSPIQPLNREASVNLPHTVTFDNTASIKYTDKFADGNNYGIEKGYNGETAGWWRPGVGNNLLGNDRQAYPDYTINGKDFYSAFYWPSGNQPIDGSVFLNGGTRTAETTINVSGHMWSVANRSQPALVDITSSNLVPDASGIIEISGAANIEFDTIRDLRFTDSHDAPFVRGDDYRVYGSGAILQVDVSEQESIGDLFDNPDRTYELTYTINQEEGVVNTYSFYTTAQVTPTSNSSVQFKRTELLRSIKIIHMEFDGSISNIEVIEDPGGYSQITRKLEAGYTRIQLISSTQTYQPTEYIDFIGDVSTVDTPGGMKQVEPEELLYNSPRFDHSTYSLVPGPSGQTWLVVPDPGSEADREIDSISFGPGNENNPSGSFLFHDSASGVQGFYQLSYDQRLRKENRVMLRADFASQNTAYTSKLNSYKLKVNDPTRKDTTMDFPGFDEGNDRGNA